MPEPEFFTNRFREELTGTLCTRFPDTYRNALANTVPGARFLLRRHLTKSLFQKTIPWRISNTLNQKTLKNQTVKDSRKQLRTNSGNWGWERTQKRWREHRKWSLLVCWKQKKKQKNVFPKEGWTRWTATWMV